MQLLQRAPGEVWNTCVGGQRVPNSEAGRAAESAPQRAETYRQVQSADGAFGDEDAIALGRVPGVQEGQDRIQCRRQEPAAGVESCAARLGVTCFGQCVQQGLSGQSRGQGCLTELERVGGLVPLIVVVGARSLPTV
jgi:hypothetical protein